MSFWSTLGKIGAGVAAPFTGGASLAAIPMIDAIGGAASAGSQAAASNRGTALQAMMDQDRMRMAAADQQRTGESDILKKLAQTAYLKSGGAQYGPTSTPAGMLPTFGFGPRPASAEQMAGASTLEQELQKRLTAPPMQLQDYASKMKPGFWEKFGGILGAGAGAYGAALKPKSPANTDY